MPTLGIRNKDGATKQIDVNGFPVAEFTEAGLKMVKPLKALPSAAPDDVAVRSQVFGLGQTRQATSKTLGVNQTNTSGKMKEINILVVSTTSNQFVRIRSVTHNMTLDIERSSAAGQELPVSARILNGEVYVVEASLAYTSWLEMETSV